MNIIGYDNEIFPKTEGLNVTAGESMPRAVTSHPVHLRIYLQTQHTTSVSEQKIPKTAEETNIRAKILEMVVFSLSF